MKNRKQSVSKPVNRKELGTRASTLSHSGTSTGVFPIVGIGASAGGLEAFTSLLKHLPGDTGLGFVLVQHLDPQHESVLTDILTRATRMPVRKARNNIRVEPNHIYVISPNTSLTMTDGKLKLHPRAQTRGAHRSVDIFLESLAQDQRERAIGVILSGTATDGTLGLEAIKAEGGITFAQDDAAKYDSMPLSAIAAGCVDFVLSPADIAKELTRIAKHPWVSGKGRKTFIPSEEEREAAAPESETALPARGPAVPEARDGAEEDFEKIFVLLRNHSGVDFSLYKSTTIRRRIARRMVLSKQNTVEDYARYLRGNTKELEALYSDALINVTSFFRNPEAFDVLKRKVLPRLLQQRGDEPFRVWVLGCSTGQEAYSIAMAFMESAEKIPRGRKLQVFATDLNEALLDKARHGLNAKNLTEDVSPERLRRFFVGEEGGYRIIKPLRESVVFARQNMISDPPFSRMDLISCRNLLIYLEPSLQQKAMPTFHYALKPDGFLFLGASESIGRFTDLFEPADKKHKIYSRKAAPATVLHLPEKRKIGERRPAPQINAARPEPPEEFRAELNAQREADRISVNEFVPPAVLINANLQVVQFRGRTSAYLEPPSGKASFDLLKMAREGLMMPLRAAINRAKKENKRARRESVRFEQEGQMLTVNLEVIPLKNLLERSFLVLFEDGEKPRRAVPSERLPKERMPGPAGKREELHRIGRLEHELSEMRDYLQSIQEQHEAANEELQASSEEVQSANEELQSINEELETSKEELESANEELTTVNEEMANRNIELNLLNSDLVNLQTSTKLPIVLLGRDLTIRRFSAEAQKQFNLLPTDIGRPITAVRHNFDLPEIGTVLADVISGVREWEREVRDKGGRWYLLRARPYLTLDNKVDGAVLVVMDIETLKQGERALAAERDYVTAILRTVPDPLVILDAQLRVDSANEAFYRKFKVSPKECQGCLIFDLDHGHWNIPKLRELLKDVLPRHSFFDHFEVSHEFQQLGQRTMLLNARTLNDRSGQPQKILLGIQDVTEVVAFQAALRQSERRYRRLFETAHDGVLILDSATRTITDANPFIVDLLGYQREELLGKELWQIGLLKDEKASQAAFRELQQKGQVRYEDLPLQNKSGGKREVEIVANRYEENGKQVIQCNIRDITERKEGEESLRRSYADIQSRAAELDRFNRIAVGRELRMIELKKEINELSQRLGEAARYPLEFESPGKDSDG